MAISSQTPNKLKRKNLCPKMTDQAYRGAPVPAAGIFQVLLPALLPSCAKSDKYAETEVYKLPLLACAQSPDHWRSLLPEPTGVK